MSKLLYLIVFSLLTFSLLDGVHAEKKHVSKLNVVATIGMLTDITREVLGESTGPDAIKKSKVQNLMGEGIDPHTYRPTRIDIQKVMAADVVFYCGLYLEGQMGSTFKRAQQRGKKIFAIGERLDKKVLIAPEGFDGHPDPHVWGDVSLWSKCVDYIAQALVSVDPENKAVYLSNAALYKKELEKLHIYAKAQIQRIPESSRVLVTAHDAFGYLGRAYGLKVRGIQGISTESEAGLADINTLVDFLVKKKIKAVFVESSISDKNIKALLEGAQSQGHQVVIGGELFSDAMGSFGTSEGTYVGMVKHNIDTIVKALK